MDKKKFVELFEILSFEDIKNPRSALVRFCLNWVKEVFSDEFQVKEIDRFCGELDFGRYNKITPGDLYECITRDRKSVVGAVLKSEDKVYRGLDLEKLTVDIKSTTGFPVKDDRDYFKKIRKKYDFGIDKYKEVVREAYEKFPEGGFVWSSSTLEEEKIKIDNHLKNHDERIKRVAYIERVQKLKDKLNEN